LEQRGEFTEAETWYRKAADTGHLKAKDSLKWLIKYRGDRAKAQNNATSDVLVGAVLHSTVQAALRSTAERQKPRPVDTHALLVELIRIDFSGDWTRIVLHAPALGAFSVPSDPGGGRVRWWEDVALTPTCAIALDAAGHLAHRYNLWPIPVGLVALALIADPTTAAAKASRGESSRGELLMMIQAEVLGMTLTGFDSAAAAALTAARNPTRTRYSRHLHSGRATSSGTGSTQPSQPFYANPVWIGALIAAVLFVVLHFIGLFP
ncbi:hypothetical protein, partial [Nocardia rhamnosiphila]